ncbi:neuronal acetylcholine receptor subunit alpha-9-like isoform X2 [Actinia tenebrosa]|nr:neuronal acetylcholine receptor subunit alpha-9-like isoform X2 [Actinia tenebrosa]
MTVNLWLRMFWKNELISWDPEKFNGIKVINVKPNKLWVPDITIFNSASKTSSIGDLYTKITSEIIVNYTGEVQWNSPAIISTECKVDVRYFPFDTQVCEIEFGSWTYDGLRVDLQLLLSYIDIAQYSVSTEWNLHKTSAKRKCLIYTCCPEPYPSALFTLVLKRRPMFFIFNMIIPCGVITLLSLFSFILPPNSGERVSFVMTVLLSLSVYMLMVTEKMPQSADTPIASKFFMSMMVQIALSLVVTCFIIKFHNNNIPIPPLFDKVINQWLASLLLMKRKHGRKRENGTENENEPDMFFKNGGFLQDDSDLVITQVHGQRQIEKIKNPENNEKRGTRTNNNTKQQDISELFKEVKTIADKIRQNDQEESKREEWMFATEVLDRFFICTLFCSISIACIVVFSAVHDAVMVDGSVD